MNNYLILIISVIVASISQIILKIASSEKHESLLKEYLNLKVMIGYFLMFLSTILTIIALKNINYKNEPIIESLGYIFVMILGRCFLNEKITKNKLIGNSLILLGIFVFYI